MPVGLPVRLTFWFIFSVLVITIAILLFEVYFSIADKYGRAGITWISDTGVTGIDYSPVEIWRWRKFMNDKITNSDGYTFVVHTDQFGFRNYGKAVKKGPNVIRILVLGDSFTEALGVGDEQTFAALLEKQLGDIKHDGKNIEVVSASCPGWSTEQEFLSLQNEAMEFEPDYVLLMCCPNDIREAWCKKFAVISNGDIKYNPVNLGTGEIFLWWLSNKSRCFQFLQQRVLHTGYGTMAQLQRHYTFAFGKEDAGNWDRPIFLNHPFAEVDSAKTLFTTLIAGMQNFCEGKKIHFAVSLTPTLMEFNGTIGGDSTTRSGLVSELLSSYCKSKGIDYIDLYDRFKAEANPASCFLFPDTHFNTKGHGITAGVLGDYYRERVKN